MSLRRDEHRLGHVGLLGDRLGHRAGDCSPSVQNLGDVADVTGHDGRAHVEVPIRRSLVLGDEAADVVNQAVPHRDEMAEVVVGEETLGREVGLVVLMDEGAVFVDQFFIAVDEVVFGVGGDVPGDRFERGSIQHVVVVAEDDPFTRGPIENRTAPTSKVVRCPPEPTGDLVRPVS